MNAIPEFDTVLLDVDARGVARLTLNRPQTHNALNGVLCREMLSAANWLAAAGEVRAVVLTGVGKTFCAGGDLDWFKETLTKTRAERVAESADLGLMLRALNELPVPLIGRINGPAYGGGIGMISVCDISIAVDTATYALTEVRLGLVPANISPYVVARMGEANARRTFLNGRRMPAEEARRLGLLSEVVPPEQLDAAVERELGDILQCARGAVAATKKLVRYVHAHDLDAATAYAATSLADAWESAEGREGMESFFAKRPPSWRKA